MFKKMFHQIPFSDQAKVSSRLIAILQAAGYQLPTAGGGIAFGVNFGWANQINMYFSQAGISSQEFIEFYCYPGNTKAQGKILFQYPRNWTKKTELYVQGVPYSLDIKYHVKFSYIRSNWETSLDFAENALRKDLYTSENFDQLTGECTKAEYPLLEETFDNCFSTDFNWRQDVEWVDKYKNNPDKKQFNLSFGYAASILIPYTQFQHLDAQNSTAVSDFLKAIEKAFSTLIP